MANIIIELNNIINNLVWGTPILALLIGTGIFMTVSTRFFQFTHFKHWLCCTFGSIFTDKHITLHTDKNDGSISQFQSLCTTLAATLGTGNIVGVASAIILGGPGSIFWMWVVSFFGMMTTYSENVLGIFYRRKNSANEWCGGPMYYLQYGLGSKTGFKHIGKFLATAFAGFCVLASFGIGNMSQVNSIAGNMQSTFGISPLPLGLILMLLGGLVILGGIKRIANVTEKLVPFMAIAILMFAFATVLGWSHYGAKAFEFLFGEKYTYVYKIIFVWFIFIGSIMKLSLAWDLSDTFNGLMAIPNLIGVLGLSPMVVKITRNYMKRTLHG